MNRFQQLDALVDIPLAPSATPKDIHGKQELPITVWLLVQICDYLKTIADELTEMNH